MISYPDLDPVMVAVGPFAIRWYGFMYTLAFLLGWPLLEHRARRFLPGLTPEKVSDLVLWILVGVMLGGRLGYILFYNLSHYLAHPLLILRVWEGGMSFHGGLIGVVVAGWLFARKNGIPFLALADVATPVMPLGLLLGRIGNFINAELWGRVTDLPWGMVFPNAGPFPRHPSQLYEALLEGVLLFALLWWLGRVARPRGVLLGVFLVGYALMRFLVEFVREPDGHLGLLALGLSMGQWLSLATLPVGAALLVRAWAGARHEPRP